MTGKNFGWGSSREHAPWALADDGFKTIIAESFADIFYNNCFKNGILLITLKKEVVDQLIEARSLKYKLGKGDYIYTEDQNQNVFVKPTTYVNNSGLALKHIMNYYNITIKDLIIIYDDIDINLGNIRFRASGADGGHNGIKSIIYHTQSDAFDRLKIGIALNPESFNISYLRNIKNIVNVIYYDLNVYKTKSIKTYALVKCLKQIQYIKSLSIPVFVGGGINENKAKEIINLLNPDGIDVSRSLKNTKNVISSKKLKNFLEQVAIA